jgi:hypothetical protein
VLACVGAICCYGIAFPYTRRHLVASGDGPFGIATGQVVLGALGSGVAHVLNTRIVMIAGGTVASSVTYVRPLFAGVALLGSPSAGTSRSAARSSCRASRWRRAAPAGALPARSRVVAA